MTWQCGTEGHDKTQTRPTIETIAWRSLLCVEKCQLRPEGPTLAQECSLGAHKRTVIRHCSPKIHRRASTRKSLDSAEGNAGTGREHELRRCHEAPAALLRPLPLSLCHAVHLAVPTQLSFPAAGAAGGSTRRGRQQRRARTAPRVRPAGDPRAVCYPTAVKSSPCPPFLLYGRSRMKCTGETGLHGR